MFLVHFWQPRKQPSISVPKAEALSISARVLACQRPQSHQFIARQRQLLIQSPNRWPKSLDRAKSASTPSIPVWLKPKAYGQAVSLEAISKKCSRHKARSEESGSQTTSLLPSFFWLRRIPAGSQAKHWLSPAAIANDCSGGV